MAVFTPLTDNEIAAFLARYNVGTFQQAIPITAGVENTNYKIISSDAAFILTVVEYRTESSALPFIIDYQRILSVSGVNCPLPLSDKNAQKIGLIKDKPALLTPFLTGQELSVQNVTVDTCQQVGELLARMHVAGSGHNLVRKNPMGPDKWRAQLQRLGDTHLASLQSDLYIQLANLIPLFESYATDLPMGSVHADLFTDSVFFADNKIQGVIDFYFSCTAPLVYDLAITAGAWVYNPDWSLNISKWHAFLQGYETIRTLSDAEKHSYPDMVKISAMRFLLSRAEDWFFRPENALVTPKDPKEYVAKLKVEHDWFS